MHLDLYDSVTPARLAAAAFHVEAEPTLPIAPGLGVGKLREEGPDEIKHPGVGGGI